MQAVSRSLRVYRVCMWLRARLRKTINSNGKPKWFSGHVAKLDVTSPLFPKNENLRYISWTNNYCRPKPYKIIFKEPLGLKVLQTKNSLAKSIEFDKSAALTQKAKLEHERPNYYIHVFFSNYFCFLQFHNAVRGFSQDAAPPLVKN